MEKDSRKNSNLKISSGLFLLSPLFIFLCLFLGSSFINHDFYIMPVLVAFSLSSMIAFFTLKGMPFDKRLEIFCKSAGDSTLITMILIFLCAGAFSHLALKLGAVESIVKLGTSFIPSIFLIPGLFLIACFLSISMGSSMGTVVAVTPIGVELAKNLGYDLAPILGAVISGAIFGDNLSIISDTTIAAVKTQGCEMRDKFRVNFIWVLPAAVLTFFLYLGLGLSLDKVKMAVTFKEFSFLDFTKILPYIIVFTLALSGVHVLVVLFLGIFLLSSLGLFLGIFQITELFSLIQDGMSKMHNLSLVSLVAAGMIGVLQASGGIHFVLQILRRFIKSKRQAKISIGLMAAVADICTANNVIAILLAGPLSRKIAEEHDLERPNVASLLDIFSSSLQGLLPYGAQILAVSSLSGISPLELPYYAFYPILLFLTGLLKVLFL